MSCNSNIDKNMHACLKITSYTYLQMQHCTLDQYMEWFRCHFLWLDAEKLVWSKSDPAVSKNSRTTKKTASGNIPLYLISRLEKNGENVYKKISLSLALNPSWSAARRSNRSSFRELGLLRPSSLCSKIHNLHTAHIRPNIYSGWDCTEIHRTFVPGVLSCQVQLKCYSSTSRSFNEYNRISLERTCMHCLFGQWNQIYMFKKMVQRNELKSYLLVGVFVPDVNDKPSVRSDERK